jgi:peptidase E
MLHVLGPQQPDPNVPACLEELGGEGTVLVITAGWRTDETDDEALKRHLGPDVVVLPLYTWFEVISRELPDLRAAYRPRQDELIRLRRLHRTRLHAALQVAWSLREQGLDDALASAEYLDAMRHVGALDDGMVASTDAIFDAYRHALQPWKEHPLVASLRGKAEKAVREARTVVLAGGHVAVLLNRMRFFGVDEALRARHAAGGDIVAWSAGAMVLTDRIVLFYDDPPEGAGYPEVLDRGLGLVPGVVLLPHARQRLSLERDDRVALFAQRFEPAACLGLENGAWLARRDGVWVNRGPADSAIRLSTDGQCPQLECL